MKTTVGMRRMVVDDLYHTSINTSVSGAVAMQLYLLLTISGLLRLAVAFEPVDLRVTFEETSGFFNVFLNHDSEWPWLRSGVVGVRNGGQWWMSNKKDAGYMLKMTGHLTGSGQDILGDFDTTTWVLMSGHDN